MSQIPDDVKTTLARLTYMCASPRSGADWQYALDDVTSILDALRADPELAARALGGDLVKTEGRVWGSADGRPEQWHEASEDFVRRYGDRWPSQVRTVFRTEWQDAQP